GRRGRRRRGGRGREIHQQVVEGRRRRWNTPLGDDHRRLERQVAGCRLPVARPTDRSVRLLVGGEVLGGLARWRLVPGDRRAGARSRSGTRWTGVAVTTSSPKIDSRTSSTPATTGAVAAANGPAAR